MSTSYVVTGSISRDTGAYRTRVRERAQGALTTSTAPGPRADLAGQELAPPRPRVYDGLLELLQGFSLPSGGISAALRGATMPLRSLRLRSDGLAGPALGVVHPHLCEALRSKISPHAPLGSSSTPPRGVCLVGAPALTPGDSLIVADGQQLNTGGGLYARASIYPPSEYVDRYSAIWHSLLAGPPGGNRDSRHWQGRGTPHCATRSAKRSARHVARAISCPALASTRCAARCGPGMRGQDGRGVRQRYSVARHAHPACAPARDTPL